MQQRKTWVYIGAQIDADDFVTIEGLRAPGESLSGLLRRALRNLAEAQGTPTDRLPKLPRSR